MKIILCLFLMQVYYSCLGYHIHDDHKGHYDYHHDPIQRPCKLQDLQCIGRYLDRSSQCPRGHAYGHAHGHAPDRARFKEHYVTLPHINASAVKHNMDVEGFNDFKIGEFYINKETNTLVLEVIFSKLRASTQRSVVTIYRKGMEPIVRTDNSIIDYRDLSLTLTAPLSKGYETPEAHVYSFIGDATSGFLYLGPQLSQSDDHLVRRSLAQSLLNTVVTLQETLVTTGPLIFFWFVENYLCGQ